jgi:hypothetical protein
MRILWGLGLSSRYDATYRAQPFKMIVARCRTGTFVGSRNGPYWTGKSCGLSCSILILSKNFQSSLRDSDAGSLVGSRPSPPEPKSSDERDYEAR